MLDRSHRLNFFQHHSVNQFRTFCSTEEKMIHACTKHTDLDELIGSQCWDGQGLSFHYGPLVRAMKAGEELTLENSAALSACMLAKVRLLLGAMILEDTSEEICPHDGFRLTLG